MGDELSARATLREANHYLACARDAIARQDHDAVQRELTTVVEKVRNCCDHLRTSAKPRERRGGSKNWWAENRSRLDEDAGPLGLLSALRQFAVHVEPLRIARHVQVELRETVAIASSPTMATRVQAGCRCEGNSASDERLNPSCSSTAGAPASGCSIRSDMWRFRAIEWETLTDSSRVPGFEALLVRDARDLCANALRHLEELVAEAEERWGYGHDSTAGSDSS